MADADPKSSKNPMNLADPLTCTVHLLEPGPEPDPAWQLRPWQQAAVEAAWQALARSERTVIAAVMGSGKSFVIAELAARYAANGHQVVVTTPTQALVDQLAAVIERRAPGQVGRFFQYEKLLDRPILVVCNASLSDLADQLHRPVGLWIADEVHRTEAPVLLQSYARLQPQRVIGLTATPFRSKEQERLSLFDTVCYRYGLGPALRDGVIVPWSVINYDGSSELGPSPSVQSDLPTGAAARLDQVCLDMIRTHALALGPGMVNAVSIEDANQFCATLVQAGIPAAVIHSRQPYELNRQVLDQLESGQLACVVHVNMLAEGIDLPWLRWLCLRRPVQARVRFIQEVGRLLRPWPGKLSALFLDPHDLFGTLGWHYREALGEWQQAELESRQRLGLGLGGGGGTPALRDPTAVDPVTAYCRQLLMVPQAYGWASSDTVQGKVWRRLPATVNQVGYLQRLVARYRPWDYLPEPHSGLLAQLTYAAARLTRGAASDLISLALVLHEHRSYPLEAALPDPPELSLDLTGSDLPGLSPDAGLASDPTAVRLKRFQPGQPCYIAGVWRRADPSRAALAIYHAHQALFSQTLQCLPDETWLSLQVRAAIAALEQVRQDNYSGPVQLATSYRPLVKQLNELLEHGPTDPAIENQYLLSQRLLNVLWDLLQELPIQLTVHYIDSDQNPAVRFAFRQLAISARAR